MKRISGQFIETSSYDETVKAFIPASLPPSTPEIEAESYLEIKWKSRKSSS